MWCVPEQCCGIRMHNYSKPQNASLLMFRRTLRNIITAVITPYTRTELIPGFPAMGVLCRLLVDSLESWLTHAGTHNVVVVVSGEGREGGALKRVWARRGFKQLAPRQARAWARELPGFPSGGRGTVLMRRRLQGAEGGGEGEREGQGAGVVAEVAGAARRVAGGVVGGLWGAAKGVVAYVTLSGR